MTSKTPKFTTAALANIAETGTNWRSDLEALRSGHYSRESLYRECVDGADDDRIEGWQDYVEALVATL